MRIQYIHPTPVDLGGTVGHIERGAVAEVPDRQGYQLVAWGHAVACEDPVAEPVRSAPAPVRRTR